MAGDDNTVFVGAYVVGRPVSAGILTFGDDVAVFEYNPDYTAAVLAGRAYALDPVNLPPIPRRVFTLPSVAHPGVFGDAAPDYWGQTVLRRLFGLTVLSPVERLVHSGEDRVGSLVFRRRGIEPTSLMPADLGALERYRRFARAMIDGSVPLGDDDLTAAAMAGSSAGGARPKCTFRDADGKMWLAKFSRPDDPVSVPATEHAAMRLAARVGINAAHTVLHASDDGTKTILVERFDRAVDGGRVPFVSAQSLLARPTMSDGTYPGIAEVLRGTSFIPDRDGAEIFRRMVFNAVCGNTDDHLKNHAMILGDRGWRLSPAYDITPQAMPDATQSLGVGRFGGVPTIENLLSEHAAFGLSLGEAKAIMDGIIGVVAGWKVFFREHGVAERDINALADADCFSRVVDLKPE